MYAWVPAGAIPCAITRAYIYVKYGKTGIVGIEPKSDRAKKTSWIKTPDREIFICTNQEHRPLDENYDECLNTSFYDDEGVGASELQYALISAHNAMSIGLWDRDFISDRSPVKIIADSGGAQLKLGTASYVDPHEVIRSHNAIADIGASLDVPPRPVDHTNSTEVTPVIKALMHVQRKNNDIFVKEKRADLKLLNVSHGFTLSQARAWCEHVDDPSNFYGWAAGADNVQSPINCLQNILVPIKHHTGEHFHLFGISGRSLVPAMAWLGKYVPHLTTDSTSYLQAVRTRLMLSYGPDGKLGQHLVGERNRTANGLLSTIPCSCAVCSRLKYMDLYALDPCYFTAAMLCIHNMLTVLHFTKMWDAAAQTCTLEEYQEKILRTQGRNANYISSIVSYVEDAMHEDMEKLTKKYASLMGDTPATVANSELDSQFWAPVDTGPKKKKKSDVTALTRQKSATVETLPNYLTPDEMAKFGL